MVKSHVPIYITYTHKSNNSRTTSYNNYQTICLKAILNRSVVIHQYLFEGIHQWQGISEHSKEEFFSRFDCSMLNVILSWILDSFKWNHIFRLWHHFDGFYHLAKQTITDNCHVYIEDVSRIIYQSFRRMNKNQFFVQSKKENWWWAVKPRNSSYGIILDSVTVVFSKK